MPRSTVTMTSEHNDGAVERIQRSGRIDLGPANALTVAGPVQRGGTLTVFANGRAIELEVDADESAQQVARRLADVLNGSGRPWAAASGPMVDLDLAGNDRRWESERTDGES